MAKNPKEEIQEMINKSIEDILALRLAEEVIVPVVDYTLEDGTVIRYAESLEVNSKVSFVTVDEDGEEILDNAPEGDYIISDTQVLVVGAEGLLVEVKEPEVIEPEVVELEDAPIVPSIKLADLVAVLGLPEIKDGYHTITFQVSEGEILWGDILSEDFQVLLSSSKSELDKANEDLVSLQAKLDLALSAAGETVNLHKKEPISTMSTYRALMSQK